MGNHKKQSAVSVNMGGKRKGLLYYIGKDWQLYSMLIIPLGFCILFKYVPMLFVFGFGVIAGIIVVIKSVKRCLEKHRSKTIYTVLGLMTGSLYAIIQGPTTLDTPKPALSLSTFSIVAFIGGGVLLFLLELFRYLMEKNAAKEELKAAIEKID